MGIFGFCRLLVGVWIYCILNWCGMWDCGNLVDCFENGLN